MYPTAGFAGSVVNYYGTHEISDLGDGLRDMGSIVRLSIGEDLCSRFDIQQDTITPYYLNYVQCMQSSSQEAGRYNVSELVDPGYANKSKYLRRSSLDPNEYFEFTALPTITAVGPNNGNVGGQYLTISGTGFSANPANNTVLVDGNDCLITSATPNELKCTLGRKDPSKSSLLSTNSSSQQKGYFGGAGLRYARYAYTSAISSMQSFVNAVRSQDSVKLGTPLEEGFRADLKEGDIYSYAYN